MNSREEARPGQASRGSFSFSTFLKQSPVTHCYCFMTSKIMSKQHIAIIVTTALTEYLLCAMKLSRWVLLSHFAAVKTPAMRARQ